MGGYISVFQSDLTYEASQGVISNEQAAELWKQLSQRDSDRWRYGWASVAYVLGAFLIIGSLTWFTSLIWEQQNLNLFYLASAYVFVFGYAGIKLWYPNSWKIPQVAGGIFSFISVCMVPVAVFGLQKYFNYFPSNVPGLFQAIAFGLAGTVQIAIVPWPFLSSTIYAALFWIVENDIAYIILNVPPADINLVDQSWISAVFGICIVISAVVIDRLRFQEDYGFWGYFFGLLAMNGGLTNLLANVYEKDIYFELGYAVVQVVLLSLGVYLQRYAFFVFGGIGFAYSVTTILITQANVDQISWISIVFGSVLTLASYYVQQKWPTEWFVFWGYLVGTALAWSGWTTLLVWPIYTGAIFRITYFLISLEYLIAAIYIKERVFLFFGVLGVLAFTQEIVNSTSWDTWWLPIFITFDGLLFIALAVYYTRNGKAAKVVKTKEAEDEEAVELEQQQPPQFGIQETYITVPLEHQSYRPIFYIPQQVPQQPINAQQQ